AVELLVRAPLRAYRHVVDLAEREGVEDGPRRGPVTPADRGDPQGRRLDRADRGENLDIVRVLAADPADDQRGRHPGRLQRPELYRQPRRVIAGHDLIVRAVTPGQLMMYALAGCDVAAHDHDGGRAGGSACPRGRACFRYRPARGGAPCRHPPAPSDLRVWPGAAPPSATGCWCATAAQLVPEERA